LEIDENDFKIMLKLQTREAVFLISEMVELTIKKTLKIQQKIVKNNINAKIDYDKDHIVENTFMKINF